jgi:hypothetical protein
VTRWLAALAAIPLASCSATGEEAVEAVSCVEGVEALRAERANFVERHTAELRAMLGEVREVSSMPVDLKDPDVGKNADFSEALAKMRETYANMTPDQIEPFATFMAEIEQRENRIRVAIRDCPEAAKMNQESVQEGAPQVQMNDRT